MVTGESGVSTQTLGLSGTDGVKEFLLTFTVLELVGDTPAQPFASV